MRLLPEIQCRWRSVLSSAELGCRSLANIGSLLEDIGWKTPEGVCIFKVYSRIMCLGLGGMEALKLLQVTAKNIFWPKVST